VSAVRSRIEQLKLERLGRRRCRDELVAWNDARLMITNEVVIPVTSYSPILIEPPRCLCAQTATELAADVAASCCRVAVFRVGVSGPCRPDFDVTQDRSVSYAGRSCLPNLSMNGVCAVEVVFERLSCAHATSPTSGTIQATPSSFCFDQFAGRPHLTRLTRVQRQK